MLKKKKQKQNGIFQRSGVRNKCANRPKPSLSNVRHAKGEEAKKWLKW
jgi:hypothetical protein